MSEYINLGDVTYFGITIVNPSGGALQNADETPQYFLYRNASDTASISANFIQRTGLIGTYRGSGDITSGNGFAVGDYVEVHASGKVGGIQGRAVIKTFVIGDIYDTNVVQHSGHTLANTYSNGIQQAVFGAKLSNWTANDTVGSGLNKISQNIYYAAIKFVKDSTVPQDEYTVQWFRNSLPISSGEITNPALSIYKTSDGTALSQNKVLITTSVYNGVLRYNESSNLVVSGEPYLVTTSGTIDGGLRVWSNPIGLDYL